MNVTPASRPPILTPPQPLYQRVYVFGLASFAGLIQSTDCSLFLSPFPTSTLQLVGLIRRAFAPDQLPSLIEALLLSKNGSDEIRCLFGDVWRGKHCGRDAAVKVISILKQ
jgi:hypothetical protein